MSHTFTVENATFEVKCNGQVLVIDLSKMHSSFVEAVLRKGAQRYWNDALAGLEPGAKLAQYRKELAIAHSGAELIKAERGIGTSAVDPVARRVLTEAKAALMVRFAKVNKLDPAKPHKIAALAAHPAVAAYFAVKDDKFTWIDTKVTEFVARELANGGRDFQAEADEFFTAPDGENSADLASLGI